MNAAVWSDSEPGSTRLIPIRNLWLLVLYASDMFRMRGTDLVDRENMPDDLPDIVAEILAHAVEERHRRNLNRAYEPRRAVLDRVRGSIDILATEANLLLHRGKVACRYEELTIDTPRNRYVRGALDKIAAVVRKPRLASRCRGLARDLRHMGVTGIVPSQLQVGANRFGRHDANDRFMVAAATVAFDLALLTETSGTHLLAVPDRDPHWLRNLFERAVHGFYAVLLTPRGWKVSGKSRLRWPIESQTPGLRAILPTMETDVELRHPATSRKIVIDTKFASLLVPARFRDTISSGYLYQIYTYLRSQEPEAPSSKPTEGVLLYPTMRQSIDEAAYIQGHLLRFATVNLAGTPKEFRRDLLRIVEQLPAGFGPQ